MSGNRGSAAIEMAILMPLFVALFATAVVTGRTATAASAVEGAAYDAARTASLARDYDSAQQQATTMARRTLDDRGVGCAGPADVEVTSEGYAAPLGEPASVTVTVTCQVTYGDVDLVGVPADRSITASFASPIDQYRARR